MLCTVAIRRVHAREGLHYEIRVTGKTSIGPSGTGGRDTKDCLTREEVDATLRSLGLQKDVLAVASGLMDGPDTGERYTSIAENVQIPFDLLERADIYLFD